MWAMCARDGLIDIVFRGPGSEGHSAIDGQVDWDQDKDTEDGFLTNSKVAGGGCDCDEQGADIVVAFDLAGIFLSLMEKRMVVPFSGIDIMQGCMLINTLEDFSSI